MADKSPTVLAYQILDADKKAAPGPWKADEFERFVHQDGDKYRCICEGEAFAKTHHGFNNMIFVALCRTAAVDLAYEVLRQRHVDDDNSLLRTEICQQNDTIARATQRASQLLDDNQRLRSELAALRGVV